MRRARDHQSDYGKKLKLLFDRIKRALTDHRIDGIVFDVRVSKSGSFAPPGFEPSGVCFYSPDPTVSPRLFTSAKIFAAP
jgi:hypothetical protein